MSVDPEHLSVFLGEADDLLKTFESSLLSLEVTPDDRGLLDAIFRSAHTMKGAAAMIEFDALATFTHEVESLLGKLRGGTLEASRGVIDVLLASLDVMRAHVLELAGGAAPDATERASVLAAIEAIRRGSGGASEHPAAGSAQAADSRASVFWFDGPETVDRPPSHPAMPPPPRKTEMPRNMTTMPRRKTEMPTSADLDDVTSTLRVPTPKVDRLINLVGEMVATQSMLSQLVSMEGGDRAAHVREVVKQMDQYCREMQERVLGIRMLPVRTIFGRFSRVIRDLGATTGKNVVLETSGNDTELDKTVLERLGEPLTHLLRNAVDHGIESPEEREALGKPRVARIHLAAYHKSGNAYIEVSEDGRGIDVQRVIAKARKNGLIAPEATPSESDAINLIFHPGFSTAETITAISGRGVGLDAVMTNITAMKGKIIVETEPGKGTCFRIILPLTLAILDGLALRVGSQIFIIPLVSVVECIHLSKGRTRVIGASEVVDVRGRVISLVHGRRIFDARVAVGDVHHGILVVIDIGTRTIGLLVDDVVGQYQVVQKSLDRGYCGARCISGATILGDGRVALIVDPMGLVPNDSATALQSLAEVS